MIEALFDEGLAQTGATRFRHAFFTRQGGLSQGIYAALNCGLGSNDAPEAVRANRASAMAWLGLPAEALCVNYQVHSARVVYVGEAPAPNVKPAEADALVTDRPGLALGVLAADCAPVLIADPRAGVIGAAHAGWKGALGGVLEATVAAMVALGAERTRMVAAIGPTIGPASYEVGPEFPAPFLALEPRDADLFRPSGTGGGRLQFDLPGYCLRRLGQAGLTESRWVGADTCAEAARFFSYRRTCLEGGKDYGRNLSAIVLTR